MRDDESKRQSDRYHPDGHGTYHDRATIDRTASSGSVDEAEARKDADMDPDETKAGQTTFLPHESSNPERFEQLHDRHHERYSHPKSAERRRDMSYDARTVAARCEFTDYQREELVRRLLNTEFSELGNPRYEAVLLAHATLIANEDGRWIQNLDLDVGDPDAGKFHAIREDFDVRRSTIRRLRKHLR